MYLLLLIVFSCLPFITITSCSSNSSNELLEWEIQNLETQVETNPDSLDMKVNLALLYLDNNQYKKAESELKDVLELEKNYTDALYALGFLYIETEKFNKAVEPFLTIVELNKDNPMRLINRQLESVYFYLGVAYHQLSSYQDAVDSLSEALTIDRTDADAWYLLGNVYRDMGHYNSAIDSYKQALRFVPEFKEVYQDMQVCYKDSGEPELAEYAQAMVDYCSGSTDKAIEQLESITARGHDYAEVYLGLGMSYEKKGELQLALTAYEHALDLDPDLWLAEMKINALDSR